jgi:hypothetical protein
VPHLIPISNVEEHREEIQQFVKHDAGHKLDCDHKSSVDLLVEPHSYL